MTTYLKLLLVVILSISANTISAKSLPKDSKLIDIGERKIHVRDQGNNDTKPTIVLLSGPNENWHSDSAWFSLLQPMLAKQYRVIAIDKAGHAWSDKIENASYQQFSTDIAAVYQKLALKDVILVCYSSSNISSLLLQKNHPKVNVVAQLWIDPDILLPHSISMYSGSPADWYKKNMAELLPHIAQGNWTERTQTKNAKEKEHINTLIDSAYEELMDWSYFQAIQVYRESIAGQQTRAIEIANYADDLASVADILPSKNIPTSIIDTDFELSGIEENNENYSNLQKWQLEGTRWSKDITQQTGGDYIPISNADHLVMFQHPKKIQSVISKIVERLTQE